MSSDTLAESAAVPDTPGRADLPRIVPRRRPGQGTAAVVVLVLLGLAGNSVLVMVLGFALGTLLAALRLSAHPVPRAVSWGYSVQLVHHRTCQVIPMPMVATVWYTVITSLLGVGQYCVEKHCARGTERTR
ncbi:hypothetical protein ACWEN4_17435 [Streptomyces violaceorubidus]